MTGAPERDTAYTDSQYRHNYPDGIDRHFWHIGRNAVVHRLLRRLPESARAGTVLDIGCGRGIAVQHMRSRGLDARGCDTGRPAPISDRVAPHLLPGTDAFALDAKLTESVRVVTALDVLEHIERPWEVTHRCRERFPHLEYLVATVPARMEIWSRYDEFYGHFRRYDRPSLATLWSADDFECVDQGYFFHGLYVVAWVLSALNARHDVEVRAPHGLLARAFHGAAGLWFRAESRLVPGSVVGSSLYVVLRRRP